MPRVPTYDNTVQETALQTPQTSAPDVSSGYRAMGEGLNQVSDAAFRFEERNAQTDAWNTQAEINKDFLAWNAERKKLAQGANAKGYVDDVNKWWDDARDKYASKLSPMAQRMIGKQLAVSRVSALESATSYQEQQLNIGEQSALEASTASLIGQAVAAGPTKANAYLDQVKANLTAWGAKKGLDPAPAVLKATTGAHMTIINQMMQNDPKGAEEYFNANKDAIEPTQWDNVTEKLNRVSAVKDGSDAADQIWAESVKGDYNTPVDLFSMEKQARDKYKDDPTRQAAAISALRERKAAWDQSQNEFNAGNTNTVYQMLDGGMGLSRVRQTPQWQALPGHVQDQILYQQEQRANVREQRAAAAENRAYNAELRQDRMLLRQNADQYMDYTDPTKLASMSRTQVQALRPLFGVEATQHLLDRYDSLAKSPKDITEAKMDEDSFKRIANDFGLNVYGQQSKTDKEQIGDLKFRVERVIAMAQQKKGAKLTEDEKETLMRGEMSRTVTVPGWFSDSSVPVIQLTPEQAAKVKVPDEERGKIVQALQTKYKQNPNNPLFAPTEDNVRRLYLQARSRSAPLIPPAKP